MGIDPNIWGPKMWTMIHLICLQAPETMDANVGNTYYMFFSMMPYVLPCDKCREHWLDHVRSFPLEQALGSRDKLFRWSVQVHNLVNKSLGKPEISYELALDHWTNVSQGKTPSTQCIPTGSSKMSLYWIWMLLILLLALMILHIFFPWKR